MPTDNGADQPAASPASPRRRLPLGIQSLGEIRERDCYYVDKTGFIARMVEEGKHYFLSRPRRFGKSLLVDTIKELFEGNEPLFRGLAVHDAWDWSAANPVVRLSFGRGNFKTPGFVAEAAASQLAAAARRFDVALSEDEPSLLFGALIEALHAQAGRRVVVLVDEYDKPILDALSEPDTARANREFLRGLYATIKDCDASVRFTLLTGVSRFSKVNLFSGLNNLRDITLSPAYSAICGYTEPDLDTVFAPELPGLDRDRVRARYDGYNWLGEDNVYNPYDVLLLFTERQFKPYWFETGTPTFLVDTLIDRGVETFSLEDALASESVLSSFEIGDVGAFALLFQTGYLTVRGAETRAGRTMYRLGYPNREVRQSLAESLLVRVSAESSGRETHSLRLFDALMEADFDSLRAALDALFAGIPHQWHTRNPMSGYEGWYASVFYACFASLGLDVRAEDSSAAGRLDMAVQTPGHVYLFEFKVAERAGEGAALAQLREKGYAEKYRGSGRPIHLVGVEFSSESRGIGGFEVAAA